MTLEGQVSQTTTWNGNSFPAIAFSAFSTVNNNYPAYTVSGQMIAGTLQVVVANGGNQSTFSLSAAADFC
ncbi:MAG: hypothetical protein ACI9WC_001568 [Arenicella sp.]